MASFLILTYLRLYAISPSFWMIGSFSLRLLPNKLSIFSSGLETHLGLSHNTGPILFLSLSTKDISGFLTFRGCQKVLYHKFRNILCCIFLFCCFWNFLSRPHFPFWLVWPYKLLDLYVPMFPRLCASDFNCCDNHCYRLPLFFILKLISTLIFIIITFHHRLKIFGFLQHLTVLYSSIKSRYCWFFIRSSSEGNSDFFFLPQISSLVCWYHSLLFHAPHLPSQFLHQLNQRSLSSSVLTLIPWPCDLLLESPHPYRRGLSAIVFLPDKPRFTY